MMVMLPTIVAGGYSKTYPAVLGQDWSANVFGCLVVEVDILAKEHLNK